MNNNEIKNIKVDVPTGISLNDKDYLNSLLSSLKEMSKNYTLSLTEASNEVLYNEYKLMFNDYISMQRDVYELMFRKGWYVLENSDSNKINNKYQTLKQELDDLNN